GPGMSPASCRPATPAAGWPAAACAGWAACWARAPATIVRNPRPAAARPLSRIIFIVRRLLDRPLLRGDQRGRVLGPFRSTWHARRSRPTAPCNEDASPTDAGRIGRLRRLSFL